MKDKGEGRLTLFAMVFVGFIAVCEILVLIAYLIGK